MKIIYTSFGLAVFLLIVNCEVSTIKDRLKDTFKHYYQDRCRDAKEENIKLFGEHLEKCDKQVIKLKQIADEVDKDKNNTIKSFRKFCQLCPELYDCAKDALNMFKKCADANDLKLITIIDELQNFMCSDGLDCLNKTSQNIRTCIIESVGHSTPNSDLSFCKDIGKIKKCIKTNLETCSSESHADAFKAYSKIVKDKLKCVD